LHNFSAGWDAPSELGSVRGAARKMMPCRALHKAATATAAELARICYKFSPHLLRFFVNLL